MYINFRKKKLFLTWFSRKYKNDCFKTLAGFFDGQGFENHFKSNAIDVAAGYSDGYVAHNNDE